MAKYNSEHLKNVSEMTVDFESIISPALRPLLGDLDGKRVLDIGCGTGRYSRLAASLNASVTAIDKGSQQITQAKRTVGSSEQNIDFIVVDVCSAEGIEGAFDIVFLMFVVLDTPTIAELNALLRASVRAMKPGATLFIADVHPHNFSRKNSVESVFPIADGDYFTVSCPIYSEVLMRDGRLREFRPSYHYPLGLIINSACEHGILLKHLSEPVFRESFPTHMILQFIKPD